MKVAFVPLITAVWEPVNVPVKSVSPATDESSTTAVDRLSRKCCRLKPSHRAFPLTRHH